MQFTEEQIKKAAACKSVEDLMELAKSDGIDLVKEEAEKFFAELQNKEITLDDVKDVAGGACAGKVCGSNC